MNPPKRVPLREAQELFEAGSANDAARLLHRAREAAKAQGASVWLAKSDNVIRQMRGQLRAAERETFDQLLERGELAAGTPTLASWGRRLAAYLIDALFVMLALILVGTVVELLASPSGDLGVVLGAAALFFFLPPYLAVSEGATGGRTLGKRLLGIVVRDQESLGPIGYPRAFGRELLRPALLFFGGPAFLIDGLWALGNRRRQTLHDKVAHTVVIRV